jgi:glycosyltransferase involved in cell wall biosynthesis
MKISICIATYNGAAYIEEQLHSIHLQEHPYNYEILVSDDSSSDDTVSLIQNLDFPNVRIIQGPKSGLVKNFENLLMNATGEIIFLSDQDDVWLPGKVSHCVELLNDTYDLIVSDARIVDKDLALIEDSFFTQRKSGKGIIKNLYKNSYLGCCMAFNRTILDASIPFPKGIAMHDWWIGLIANSIGNVKFLDEPLIMYRRHGGNVSATTETSKSSIIMKLNWRNKLLLALISRIAKLKLSNLKWS